MQRENASALGVRERIDLAEKLYLQARSPKSITATLCTRYGVTARQARRYLARATARIAARPRADLGAVRERAETMLLESYRLAKSRTVPVPGGGMIDQPDTKAMATAARYLADLDGAFAPVKHEHSGTIGITAADVLAELTGDAGGVPPRPAGE